MHVAGVGFMTRILTFGRVCFGLGMVGLGLTHFAFRQFTTGRAPAWPASVPGGVAWAYVTGLVVIAIGVAIVFRWRPRSAAIVGVVMIAGWALLRHIPVLFQTPFLAGSWTQAGKALALIGGLSCIAAVSPTEWTLRRSRLSSIVNGTDSLITVARVCLGIFFLITGTQHFIHTPFVASLIPTWFPGDAVRWTYFAGAALLAGGVGLLVRRSARIAGLLAGLMVFSWFWIIHLPRAMVSVSDGIAVYEALAVAGIAFTIAGALSESSRESHSEPTTVAVDT